MAPRFVGLYRSCALGHVRLLDEKRNFLESVHRLIPYGCGDKPVKLWRNLPQLDSLFTVEIEDDDE